ncbi:MAG: hypothetical protein OHK0031_01290 [Anaerolineales bacterium]
MTDIKIAFATEDEKTISNHFGMAAFYRVAQLREGQLISLETRAKPHHESHPDHAHGAEHGGVSHGDMFAPIGDCQILVVGGMGSPAHAGALSAGLQVILASGEIQSALAAYQRGNLASDDRRIHAR